MLRRCALQVVGTKPRGVHTTHAGACRLVEAGPAARNENGTKKLRGGEGVRCGGEGGGWPPEWRSVRIKARNMAGEECGT